MLREQQLKYAYAIRKLLNDGPERPWAGICHNLRGPEGDWLCCAGLSDLVQSWPGYSGRETFPVPHPYLDPEFAYFQPRSAPDDWPLWQGEYGEARRELLRHLQLCLAYGAEVGVKRNVGFVIPKRDIGPFGVLLED